MAKWFGKILCCTGLENFTNYYAQFHYKENEFSDFSQYLQANIETVHLPHTNPRPLSEVIFQLNYSLLNVSVGVTDSVIDQAVSHGCPTRSPLQPDKLCYAARTHILKLRIYYTKLRNN